MWVVEAGGEAAGEGEVMSGVEDWAILKGSGREGGERVRYRLYVSNRGAEAVNKLRR